MNNYISYAAAIIAVVALVVAFGVETPQVNVMTPDLSGVTNFDSLQLKPSSSSDNALEVEDSSGTDVFVINGTGSISATAATSTLGCLRIYQYGATTVASTTYYLVASTTFDEAGSQFATIFATSSKPTYCN